MILMAIPLLSQAQETNSLRKAFIDSISSRTPARYVFVDDTLWAKAWQDTTLAGLGKVWTSSATGIGGWATPTTGLNSLNGLTGTTQTFALDTAYSSFGISSVGTAHTFRFPAKLATIGTAAQMDSARVMTLDGTQTVTGTKIFTGSTSFRGSAHTFGIASGTKRQGAISLIDTTSSNTISVITSSSGVNASAQYFLRNLYGLGSDTIFTLSGGGTITGATWNGTAIDSIYQGQHDHLQSEVIALSDTLGKYSRKTDTTAGTTGRITSWAALRDTAAKIRAEMPTGGSGTFDGVLTDTPLKLINAVDSDTTWMYPHYVRYSLNGSAYDYSWPTTHGGTIATTSDLTPYTLNTTQATDTTYRNNLLALKASIVQLGDSTHILRDSIAALRASIGSGTGAPADSTWDKAATDSLVALAGAKHLHVGGPTDTVFIRNLYSSGGIRLFDESGIPYFSVDSAIIANDVYDWVLWMGLQDSLNARQRTITNLADTSKYYERADTISGVTGRLATFAMLRDTAFNIRAQMPTGGTSGSTGDTVKNFSTNNITPPDSAHVTITTPLSVNGAILIDRDTIITRSGEYIGAPPDTSHLPTEKLLHRGWGGIYIDDADPDTMSTTTLNVFKTVKGWTTGGVLYGATVQDSSITIQNAGTYEIRWKTTIDGANYGDDSQFNGYAYVDDVKQTKSGDKISLHNSLDLKTLGGFCLANLTAGQIVKVKIAPASAADPSGTVYIRYANLVVTRIN
jgi:hypothetical protein